MRIDSDGRASGAAGNIQVVRACDFLGHFEVEFEPAAHQDDLTRILELAADAKQFKSIGIWHHQVHCNDGRVPGPDFSFGGAGAVRYSYIQSNADSVAGFPPSAAQERRHRRTQRTTRTRFINLNAKPDLIAELLEADSLMILGIDCPGRTASAVVSMAL